jgi:hypothetical protein
MAVPSTKPLCLGLFLNNLEKEDVSHGQPARSINQNDGVGQAWGSTPQVERVRLLVVQRPDFYEFFWRCWAIARLG